MSNFLNDTFYFSLRIYNNPCRPIGLLRKLNISMRCMRITINIAANCTIKSIHALNIVFSELTFIKIFLNTYPLSQTVTCICCGTDSDTYKGFTSLGQALITSWPTAWALQKVHKYLKYFIGPIFWFQRALVAHVKYIYLYIYIYRWCQSIILCFKNPSNYVRYRLLDLRFCLFWKLNFP